MREAQRGFLGFPQEHTRGILEEESAVQAILLDCRQTIDGRIEKKIKIGGDLPLRA
jgi:hypothetical protein